MTTIILLLMFPIGIAVYFFDKKLKKQNEEIFNAYVEKIMLMDISKKDMLDQIDEMYYANGYKRVSKTDTTLLLEKKHFNLGVLFMFFGVFLYFGIIFYLIYYYFILTPEKIDLSL